ncbi:MAG: hypothetical protein EOS36_03875 [Mesorhizobium sp.]|nr:MAG: hypothetical protein EOS36_03875 [Mesorhizobium sp.]RWE40101.1 MAG: hypothetical protein EOS79_19600 [Mesorhizobium sp.]
MTSGAVAAWTYGATGSLLIAVAWTIVALVLLQAAYSCSFSMYIGHEMATKRRKRSERTGKPPRFIWPSR